MDSRNRRMSTLLWATTASVRPAHKHWLLSLAREFGSLFAVTSLFARFIARKYIGERAREMAIGARELHKTEAFKNYALQFCIACSVYVRVYAKRCAAIFFFLFFCDFGCFFCKGMER